MHSFHFYPPSGMGQLETLALGIFSGLVARARIKSYEKHLDSRLRGSDGSMDFLRIHQP